MRNIFLIACSLFLSISAGQAQSLEKILEDHLEAVSQDKLEDIETIITSGKTVYSMAGIESPFTIYQARPDRLRIEAEFQGSKVIQTYNGETGWMYAPAMGIAQPQELKGEELETFLDQAEFDDPLWKPEERGNTIELEGESDDGLAHHLVVTKEDGNVRHFYLDKESHMITSLKTRQVMGGAESEIEVLLENYSKFRGIPVAKNLTTKMNGQIVTTIRIEKVEYNRKIDPELFEKPEI